MGKKAVEMGRYGTSELMRNNNLQKKTVNYGINKLTPFIQDSVGTAMDQLSTKVRPNKKYKTDRKDLDGGGLIEDMGKKLNDIVSDPQKFKEYQLDQANYAWQQAQIFGYRETLQKFLAALGLSQIGSGVTDKLTKSGVAGSPYHVDFKTGFKLLSDPDLWKMPSKKDQADGAKKERALKNSYDAVKRLGFKGSELSFSKKLGMVHKPSFTFPGSGGAIDIHKQIGKLPKPKGGWALPGHKYTGPYNDLENQVRYNPETGEILEIYDQPTRPTDAVAMQHDVDYSVCGDDRKCKNKADRKMVKSLDAIPWKKRQWGHTLTRTIINTKQKLGLGLNAQRR